jgi:hypothetical protein
MKYNFKIGDKVKCKIGFNTDGNWKNEKSGGAGYILNKVLTINRFSDGVDKYNTVAWFDELDGKGCFLQALELENQELNIEIW